MTDLTNAAATPVSLLIGAPVLKTPPDADLFQVCAALAGGGVGMLVVAENSHVEGVVSERDVVQALADRRDPATTRRPPEPSTSPTPASSGATPRPQWPRLPSR